MSRHIQDQRAVEPSVCGASSGDMSPPRTASTAPSQRHDIVCVGGGKKERKTRFPDYHIMFLILSSDPPGCGEAREAALIPLCYIIWW